MMPKLCVTGMPLSDKFTSLNSEITDLVAEADVIIGEEKKITHKVLARSNCRNKNYYLLNEHSSLEDKMELLNTVKKAELTCLFSDHGTPCVCDPGYDFVNMCFDEGIDICSYPGPSSITTALSVSGFYAEKFYFAGFPPRENKARKEFLKNIFSSNDTVVFFERPYVMGKLSDELKYFKGRITVAYNLGMINEKIIRGYINNIVNELKQMPKSPFVIVLEGKYA